MADCQVCDDELGQGRCFVCRDYRATAIRAGEGGVRQWSGAEARALRLARRMTIREFAGHLGVSDRLVSKWEAGCGQVIPRPVNQAALDTSLSRCDLATRTRFAQFVEDLAMYPTAPDGTRGFLALVGGFADAPEFADRLEELDLRRPDD